MNETIIKQHPERNKWKQFKYQNISCLNKNTLHTFGSIYSHLTEYFTNLVGRLSDIKLLSVEHPTRDRSFNKIVDSNKKMVERTALPRAVMLYNLDVNFESDYKIPNQHRLNWLNHTRVMEVFSLKYSQDDEYIDYLKDLTINMVGSIQESLGTVFFSVLTDSKASHIELVRKLKMAFPDDSWQPLYRTEKRDPNTERIIEVPYTVEYSIPREIIEIVKKILKIPTDELLAKFLKKYSYNKIIYKISGEDQTYEFYVELFSIIKLKCVNIEDGIYTQENSITTYIAKLEFSVRYVDLSAYKMSIIGYILNILNPDNYHKEPDDPRVINDAQAIFIKELPNEINGTTEFNSYEFQYIDEDFKEYYIDMDKNIINPNPYFMFDEDLMKVKYGTLPICNITDNGLVNEYIEYISDEYTDPEEFEKYVNIILTSRKVSEEDKNTIISNKNMLKIKKDYLFKRVIDLESQVGDSIYISIYLNMKHFNNWKTENGYGVVDNLSSLYK